MFPEEPTRLKDNLEKAMKKGVNLKVLTAPNCLVDQVEVPVQEILKDLLLEIKFFPVPFIKLVVRGKKEMLIAFCRISGNSTLSETTIGIWNQYSEFVETITGVYEFIWKTDNFNIQSMSFNDLMFKKDIG